jgi:metal-responsive CopG/Arc/MetJ family transcriptional regulator
MRTVQMRLEDELIDEVDAAARRAKTTRTAFTRAALRAALEKARIAQLVREDQAGYRRKPIKPGEFDVSDDDTWPD